MHVAASEPKLQELRKGCAEHGEAWLRDELGKRTRDQPCGRAAALVLVDAVAASEQKLQELREGCAEHGEAWLRDELGKRTRDQLRGLAVAADAQQNIAAHCRAGRFKGNRCR
ncbi:cysS [Symbiodinium sp. CCMP2592]|nr:cysS [Symbiodinium sp. CCMP2592]